MGHQLVPKVSASHLLCLNPTAWKPFPNFISLKVPDVEPRLRFPGQKKRAVHKDLLNTSTMKCRNASREKQTCTSWSGNTHEAQEIEMRRPLGFQTAAS